MKQQGWIWLGLQEIINGLKFPKKEIIITSKPEKYTKTYSSFAGADIICYINEQPVGEIVCVSWNENLKDNKLEGTLVLNEYGESIESKLKNNIFDLLIVVCAEYTPDLRTRTIKGIKISDISSGLSIDDVATEVALKFTAEEITDFKTVSRDKLLELTGRK